MKPLRWILLLWCALVSLSGCDPLHTDYRYFLTETEAKMIPYEIGNTIHFVDGSGKASILEVKEDVTTWRKHEDEFSTFIWECREVRLLSEHSDLSFDLDIESFRLYDGSHVYVAMKPIGIDFRAYYDSKWLCGAYDSLKINNHIYYNVVVTENREHTSQLYYNIDYGILQVTLNEKSIFTLIP